MQACAKPPRWLQAAVALCATLLACHVVWPRPSGSVGSGPAVAWRLAASAAARGRCSDEARLAAAVDALLASPLPPRNTNISLEAPLVYHHQRKAAGSSYRQAVVQGARGAGLPLFAACRGGVRCETFSLAGAPPSAVYAGHFPWAELRHLERAAPGWDAGRRAGWRRSPRMGASCLTNFRDPLARLESCFYYKHAAALRALEKASRGAGRCQRRGLLAAGVPELAGAGVQLLGMLLQRRGHPGSIPTACSPALLGPPSPPPSPPHENAALQAGRAVPGGGTRPACLSDLGEEELVGELTSGGEHSCANEPLRMLSGLGDPLDTRGLAGAPTRAAVVELALAHLGRCVPLVVELPGTLALARHWFPQLAPAFGAVRQRNAGTVPRCPLSAAAEAAMCRLAAEEQVVYDAALARARAMLAALPPQAAAEAVALEAAGAVAAAPAAADGDGPGEDEGEEEAGDGSAQM